MTNFSYSRSIHAKFCVHGAICSIDIVPMWTTQAPVLWLCQCIHGDCRDQLLTFVAHSHHQVLPFLAVQL